MTVGALRRQIVIEQRDAGEDALGQLLDTWSTVCTCYADIQPQSGKEVLGGEANVSSVASIIEIRYRTNVTAAMRARYAGRVFNIEAVIDVDTMHRRLHLVCTEGMNQG